MSGWAAYLADVKDISAGSAIISLEGALCGKEGKWEAKQAEMQNYAACLKNIASAQSKGITYNGKKYIIVRAVDDSILAQLGKEALVLQKAKTVLVVAKCAEGQVPAAASAGVSTCVAKLMAANC